MPEMNLATEKLLRREKSGNATIMKNVRIQETAIRLHYGGIFLNKLAFKSSSRVRTRYTFFLFFTNFKKKNEILLSTKMYVPITPISRDPIVDDPSWYKQVPLDHRRDVSLESYSMESALKS